MVILPVLQGFSTCVVLLARPSTCSLFDGNDFFLLLVLCLFSLTGGRSSLVALGVGAIKMLFSPLFPTKCFRRRDAGISREIKKDAACGGVLTCVLFEHHLLDDTLHSFLDRASCVYP